MKALFVPTLAAAMLLQAATAGAQQVGGNMQLASSNATGRDSVAPRPLAQKPEESAGLQARSLLFLIDSLPGEVFAHDPSAEKPLPGVPVHAKNYLNHEGDNFPATAKEIVFTRSADPASAKAADQRIARATVPPNLKSAIFLFVPGSGRQGEDLARVMVIDDSARSFPAGSLKVMNFSPQPVRIQLENKDFDFKVGEVRNIEDPPVGANQTSGMRSFTFKDNQWQRIGAGIWPHPGTKRVLQIIFMNPATNQIEVRGVRDVTSV